MPEVVQTQSGSTDIPLPPTMRFLRQVLLKQRADRAPAGIGLRRPRVVSREGVLASDGSPRNTLQGKSFGDVRRDRKPLPLRACEDEEQQDYMKRTAKLIGTTYASVKTLRAHEKFYSSWCGKQLPLPTKHGWRARFLRDGLHGAGETGSGGSMLRRTSSYGMEHPTPRREA